MRKYFKYTIFILVLFLILNINVSAKICQYEGGGLKATIKVNDVSYKVIKSTIQGGFDNTTDEGSKSEINESQSVENWSKKKNGIDFFGKDFFSLNQECPTYSILVDRYGQFDLFVSDEEHLNEFMAYAEKKQGYAIMELLDEDKIQENYPTSCYGLEKDSCQNNPTFSCIWNKQNIAGVNYSYCNVDKLVYVACGDAKEIPYQIPALISFFVNLLKISVPLILIFVSIITLLKAMAASKEDEIKKAQSSLVKKIISAVLVFFIISIVQFVISKVTVSEDEQTAFSSCLNCFLNNKCEEVAYYMTSIDGKDWCTTLATGEHRICEYKDVIK